MVDMSRSMDAAGFTKALLDLVDYTGDNIELAIRKTCIDLYTKIVKRTPVDTGRAKASWGLSVGRTDPPTPPEEGWPEKGGWSDSARGSAVAKYVDAEVGGFSYSISDNTVTIRNNLEYMEYLEDGTSKQAASGMVAVSMAEFEASFAEHLRGLKGMTPT